jgi:protein-S-isoprenylcysteine O-methyltransferase Ste14
MSLLNNEGLRVFFSGRRRFQLAWIFAILLAFSAKNYPSALGTAICFIGASLRFWSSGFLRKESKLAVGGPYSYTRNPLYLGTFIMALGATISVGAVGLAVVMAVVFFLNYHYVIDHEEKKLPSYFGESYLQYCNLVPRFIPQFTTPAKEDLLKINSDPVVYSFSMQLAKENKAFEAYASFVGVMLGMSLLVFIKAQLGIL